MKKRSPCSSSVTFVWPRIQRMTGLFAIRLLVGEPPHLDAGHQQEGAEDIEQPMELRDEPDPGENHDSTHDDRAENTKDEDTFLEFERNGEETEEHQPDEHVVTASDFSIR